MCTSWQLGSWGDLFFCFYLEEVKFMGQKASKNCKGSQKVLNNWKT